MKTKIKLPIPTGVNRTVNVHDKITVHSVLYTSSDTGIDKSIHLSRLLRIKPNQIHKYLKAKIGSQIKSGEVIAEKRSLFQTVRVKSPESATFKELNLSTGTIILTCQTEHKTKNIFSPVSGKVLAVGEDHIEIETEGHGYSAVDGRGLEMTGILSYLGKKGAGSLDILDSVEDKIILCEGIQEDAIIKLDVLGALGIITLSPVDPGSLSWVQVESDVFDKLKKSHNQKVLIWPDRKEIIAFDSL